MGGRADLDVHVPAWFACRQLGITKQTFAYWVTSGKLTPAGGRPDVPLYRYGDVLAAEQATRHSPNSRRGVRLRAPASVGASS